MNSRNVVKILYDQYNKQSLSTATVVFVMLSGAQPGICYGDKRGVWGQKSPSGVKGQSARRVWEKPETHTEYSTERNT